MRVAVSCLLALVCAGPATGRQDSDGSGHTTQPSQDILSLADLNHLGIGQAILIEGVQLTADVVVDLAVQRFDVLTHDAILILGGARGERRLQRPDVVLLRGLVNEEPGSRVFIGVSATGSHGFIEHEGIMHVVSTGPYSEDAWSDDLSIHITRADELLSDAAPGPGCATDVNVPEFTPNGNPMHHAAGSVDRGSDWEPPCRLARIAIDTDWQFTELFAGNANAAAAYAMTLLAAVGEIYRNDLNTSIMIPWLRVWDSDDDPYHATGSGGRLAEVRSEWVGHHDGIERELVHLLSGESLGGGVAYLDVLCSNEWGYAISGNLHGSFPMPLVSNSDNWDVAVVAHETGHNFGTVHTHAYDPPIDECGNNVEDNCAGAADGTIMSYCHTCPGGMSNIALHFHPIVVKHLLDHLDSQCDITAGPVTIAPDIASTLADHPVEIDVLANDRAVSCEPALVVLAAFDVLSEAGGVVELISGEDENQTERLRYTPPAEYAGDDSFEYQLLSGEATTVQINVVAPRPADHVASTAPGVEVAYYLIPEVDILPDFDTFDVDSTAILPDILLPSTLGNFATSGHADHVGAVFTGFVEIASTGFYTFYTVSDDGSRLFIGDTMVVDNDGQHGMRERSGWMALAQGLHAIRVEFFENTGGAGLAVSMRGDDIAKAPIPAALWFHETQPCPGDVNGDGQTDLGDLLAIISSWGQADAYATDVTADGVINLDDLLMVIANWGSGC